MSWIIPENKLDDQQRHFYENVDINSRNMWIRGFPGSGKSVLLAYTLKKIKKNNPNARVAVVVFTRSLITMFKAAFAEMGISANIMTFYEFMDSGKSYDYILCDEVQDLVPSVLRAMNSRASHVIVAGDENQSIFESDPRYRESTVIPSQIKSMLDANDYELSIIHRLSSSIISAVQRFLPGLNVFTAKRDLAKQSTQIRLCSASTCQQEASYVYNEAKKAVNVGQTAGILLPAHDNIVVFVNEILSAEHKPIWTPVTNNWGKIDYAAMNSHLYSNGILIQYVGNGYGSFSEDSRRITLMTYHSSKGLDFDNVFLPSLDDSLFISRNEHMSKILFMVAMTRSRNNLYLTYCGRRHSYLNNFASDCNNISIGSNPTNGGNVFGF